MFNLNRCAKTLLGLISPCIGKNMSYFIGLESRVSRSYKEKFLGKQRKTIDYWY